MFSRLILLLIVLATNSTWAANGIALIDDNHDDSNLIRKAQYFIDNSRQLPIDTIASEEYTKHFLPINRNFLQLGLVQGNIWIRADVAIRTTKDTQVLLELKAPRLEHLDVYIPSMYDNQSQARLGEARPYTNRPIESPNYLFPLPTNAPPVFTLYLRLSSHLPINAQIHLKTLSKSLLDSQEDLSLTGAILGSLLILFLGNLFFYIKSSRPMYLLYSALLVGVAIFHLALHGQLYQFFPSRIGLQERIYNFSALACMVVIIFFSRLYLETKSYFPTIDRALIALGVTTAFFAILFTISPHFISIVYLSVISSVVLVSLTALAILAYTKNLPSSGYYLTARITLLIGYFSWLLSVYGIIPSPAIYEWGVTSAIIVEAIIHFTGMAAQLTPSPKGTARHNGYTQSETYDLLSDLSSRLRRQINVIDGGFQLLEQSIKSDKLKSFIHNGLTANYNLQELSQRLDTINTLRDKANTHTEHSAPLFLTKMIDEALNHFQKLDQDSASVELFTHNIEHVELLHDAEMIQHLIETLLQELKFFTDQTLTLTVSKQDQNHDKMTTLEIKCHPLPSRISMTEESYDIGMKYISLLVNYLNGEIKLIEKNRTRSLIVRIPITSHIRHTNNSNTEQPAFYDLILFGEHDKDLQTVLNILQTQPNSITHFAQIDELVGFLETPQNRDNGSVILVLDNGGNIPHVTHQKIHLLMKEQDQCLLITNNVKISRDYAKTIGFDELLTVNELESQLLLQLSRLIRKGERLKHASLSRVKDSNKAP